MTEPLERAPEEAQPLLDRIDNLERELAAEVVKRENVEEFMRARIMNMEEKLMDCQSAGLICQKALTVFMSDQLPPPATSEELKQLKVI